MMKDKRLLKCPICGSEISYKVDDWKGDSYLPTCEFQCTNDECVFVC
jgi:hypothetical protein